MLDELGVWLENRRECIIAHRRYLHANPEVSWHEHKTTAYIIAQLEQAGLSPRILPNGTGVICDIGQMSGKFRTAIRADIDALPITEDTGVEFSSTNPGVSHSCGHDIHTAILLAVGEFLAYYHLTHSLPFPVRLIFQPAEEHMPGGALAVIAANELDDVREIIAVHCDPKIMVNQLGIKVGAITSAADKITLTVSGSGGHTSRPHLTSDTVGALAAVIYQLPYLLSRRVDPRTSTVMVWGSVHAGDAANAIPATGYALGTIRTTDRDTWLALEDIAGQIIDSILAPFGIDYELDYHRGVPPVVNDPNIIERLEDACLAIPGIHLVPTDQSSGGEDFSWYLEHVPGAMLRLGVGSNPEKTHDLHQPEFLADERALDVGIQLFISYLLQDNS